MLECLLTGELPRLLVVESDPEIRAQLRSTLCEDQVSLAFAQTSDEAMAFWQSEQPDLVLTEVSAAGIDGLAMTESLRLIDPDAAIVMLSAADDARLLRRAIEIGIDGYVAKPIDPPLLIDAVNRALRDRQRVLDLRMARMVFEVANEGILITDDKSRILAVNPAFSQITGYRPDEVVGRRTSVLSSGLHTADFYRAIWDSLQTHGRWAGEVVNRRKDGVLFSEWLSIASVDGAADATPRRFVGLVSDITQRKREEERIRRLAHFDSLTGLPNRVLFHDRLLRSMARARRHGSQLAVLYLDLDHFKEINDQWGHAVGDAVLQVAGSRMIDVLRQSDTVSRRGGDEFVILVELLEHGDGLVSICRKLIAALGEPIQTGQAMIHLGVSIGVALFPVDADEADALLAAADCALYEAKHGGRGQYCFYHPQIQQSACHRLEMERTLRAGLDERRYVLRYLPEISLQDGAVTGLEALLRFEHPELGLLEAGRFLEQIEDMGLMPELGYQALALAAHDLMTLGGASPRLVIDLSAKQLAAPEAASRLLAVLENAGLDPSTVNFECTEAALVGNDAGLQAIYQLAAAGCQFTLDDFGAGFCSFSLISQLPMSSIKIDRSFTAEIDRNPQIRELVGALIAFARRLGLRAVAEGVENPVQLAVLRDMGCDAVQGYHFGRPQAFADWLAHAGQTVLAADGSEGETRSPDAPAG